VDRRGPPLAAAHLATQLFVAARFAAASHLALFTF